ncbi:MAG: DMT family transporter [Planctomycetota bacterium]
MPYLSFFYICLVWGASFILMDRAALALGPVSIALGRLLGGALLLGIVWWWSGPRVRISRSDWGHIFVVALLANSLPFVIQPYTMIQAGEHAYFGMMVALVPLATILVSIPMLGKWPTSRQLVGVLGGMACMYFAVQDGTARGISTWLLALALSVPIIYALGNTYVKWKLSHLPALPVTTLFLAMGGLLLLPLQLSPSLLAATELGGPAEPQSWPVAVAALVVLSVFGTGIGILLFVKLINGQGPLFAGMVTYVIPMLALLWGQLDKELLTTTQLLAIVGVLAMVALVQWGAVGESELKVPGRGSPATDISTSKL